MRKKALRKDFYMEIRKSFGRFLSIFFVVAIGTAFFSGIRAAEPDMRLSGDAYFDQSKLMDLQVVSTMGLTADDLQAIREIKGVEQAQPVYSMDALCDVDGSQKVVHIFSSQDGINELKVEKGRMPEKADECVADADFLASSEYQIGDKITFLKDEDTEVTEELTQSTFQIVGSVSSPEYISFSRGSSMIGNGSVSGFISVLPESFQMDAYTEISIQVKGAKEETAFTKEYDNLVDETKKQVEAIQSEREDIRREELMQQMDQKQAELLAEVPSEAMEIAAPQIQQQIEQQKTSLEQGKWYVNDREDLTEYSGYGENADRMRAIGRAFPVLFFLVAALISLTSMTRMVEEQRTQIGTLKALGYSRRSIAGKYLGYAFWATVGGCVSGVLVGEKILPYIIVTAYGIMYPHMNTAVIPYNLYYGVSASLTALLCTMGATLFSCYKELREQAAELMRPPAPKKGKRVFLEKIPSLWSQFNFIWKATIRNLLRYKKRFFMTVFGIGGCMALLLVGFGLRDSIVDIAKLQYHELQLYDANIILNTSASKQEQNNVEQELYWNDQVDKTAVGYLGQMKVKHGNEEQEVYLNVPEDLQDFEEMVVFRDRRSYTQYDLETEGVILTEKTAKLLEVKEGDTITLCQTGKEDVKVKVGKICENYIGHYLYMSPEIYQSLYGEEPQYNSVYFQMKKGYEDQLEILGEDILKGEGALNISYTDSIEDQLDDMLGSLDIVMAVLVISAGLLAFVVLYNLNSINITERRRELATLKVLGFYDNEVSAYVYRENMILTVIGGVAGIILGSILHRFVIVTVEVDSAMFGRSIEMSSYGYSFLITLAFSVFVNLVMYFKLKKIDMVESLKSVE